MSEAGAAGDGRRKAERILNRNFVVYICFSAVLAALMVVGLAASPPEPRFASPQKAGQFTTLSKELLVLLFFSATIICLGVRWGARIVAARRFSRSDPRRAALAFAVSQWICFAVYAVFALAAFYYRMAAAGQRTVLVAATAAAILASLYFLRAPLYLLNAIFVSADQDVGEREAGTGDDGGRD